MIKKNLNFDLISDYFLVKNEHSKNFYSFVKSEFIIAGSVKNNEIEIKKQNKIFDMMFISQFRSKVESYYGTNNNIGLVDHAYFKNFEQLYLGSGNDSVYFGGEPDNNIQISAEEGNDIYNFNYALTSNVTATGGAGDDTFNITTSPNTGELTLKGGLGVDSYNFSSNI